MPPPTNKSKEDRVKETIRLLRALKANGVSERHYGYREIKDLLATWIENGEAAEGKIDLFQQNRIAHVSLPKEADKAATIALKVIQEIDADLD